MQNIQEVSGSGAYDMITKGALLVDVRELREASSKSFDVAGVMQIPLGEFEKRYREIPLNRTVILACRSGFRSMMAAGLLIGKGYGKVFNLRDGIMSWERAGLPTKSSSQDGFLSRVMSGILKEA
jgi:rhodanese-related sulfurtransferase